MSEPSSDVRITTHSSFRRTVALLLAWVAAAVVAGVPSGAASTASAEPRAGKVPVVVNTGPECFAGHAAPPAAGKGRD
jgi:hypothetical protein